MRTLKHTLLILLNLLILLPLSAKDKIVKWGSLSKEEINLKSCYYDTLAPAVVLSDIGMIHIRYSQTPITVERHVRIKILDRQGLGKANVELPFYSKDNTEDIVSVKAQTLKIRGAKVEKYELPKSEIFKVKVNDNYSVIRFALPQVEPGDVIEYRYTLYDRNVVIPEGWVFQTDIPTLYSEYSAMVEEGWDVRIYYISDLLILKYGSENSRKWILENLPAIKEEPLSPCPDDFTHRLTFQLAGYLASKPMGGTEYKTISMTWDELATEFLTSWEYDDFLGPDKTLRQLGEVYGMLPADERLRAIYRYFSGTYRWDQRYRAFPGQRLSRFLEVGSGNSADINLAMINVLRASGLDAHPVLLSTKSHGIVRKEYPLLAQFNHVIAGVRMGEELVFLDATDPHRSYNLLDEQDYNSEGLRIISSASSWVKLPDPPASAYQCLLKYDISRPDSIRIEMQVVISNHEAARIRRELSEMNNVNAYVTGKLLNRELGVELSDSVCVENLLDPDLPLQFTIAVSPASQIKTMNEVLIINPFLLGVVTDPPLKPGPRYFPVDFTYKRRIQQITNIVLPSEQLKVSFPKTDKLVMSGDRMKFSYLVLKLQDKVQLVHDLQINDTYFLPNEVKYMLEIYRTAVSRQVEPVVIEEQPVLLSDQFVE